LYSFIYDQLNLEESFMATLFEIPYFSQHQLEYVDVIFTDITKVIFLSFGMILVSICPHYTIAEMNMSCSSGTRIAAEGLGILHSTASLKFHVAVFVQRAWVASAIKNHNI
jgi:hypothetical protein